MAFPAAWRSARVSVRSGAAVSAALPASSVAFDWVMAVLSALLMAGVIQDGWAHSHGQVDQSFLTPWHALLYSMMAINGLVLGAVGIRNKLRGYATFGALPYGYALSLCGVILFALGGGFDLYWHTAFGIESGIDALLSPSHLVLAFAAILIFSGPIRSLAVQYGSEIGGWKRIGPAVLAVTATLTMLGFFVSYAQPIEDGFTNTAIVADASGPVAASLFEANATGAQLTRLSVPPKLDVWGVVASPDGRHIAYRAQAAQTTQASALLPSDLYVASPDGSHAVRITHSGRHNTEPAWSPDGRTLAYVSMPAGTSGNFSAHRAAGWSR